MTNMTNYNYEKEILKRENDKYQFWKGKSENHNSEKETSDKDKSEKGNLKKDLEKRSFWWIQFLKGTFWKTINLEKGTNWTMTILEQLMKRIVLKRKTKKGPFWKCWI